VRRDGAEVTIQHAVCHLHIAPPTAKYTQRHTIDQLQLHGDATTVFTLTVKSQVVSSDANFVTFDIQPSDSHRLSKSRNSSKNCKVDLQYSLYVIESVFEATVFFAFMRLATYATLNLSD